METVLEYTSTELSPLFGPKCLASAPTPTESANMAIISLNRERWGLSESPTETFILQNSLNQVIPYAEKSTKHKNNTWADKAGTKKLMNIWGNP